MWREMWRVIRLGLVVDAVEASRAAPRRRWGCGSLGRPQFRGSDGLVGRAGSGFQLRVGPVGGQVRPGGGLLRDRRRPSAGLALGGRGVIGGRAPKNRLASVPVS